MADSGRPTPVPARLRDEVSATLAQFDTLPEEVRWRVRRLVGFAYAEGYADGHGDGSWETHQDARQASGG